MRATFLPVGAPTRNHVSDGAPLEVDGEGFQLAGQHRFLGLVVNARPLAQLLVRADSAAGLGQGAGLVIQAGGL